MPSGPFQLSFVTELCLNFVTNAVDSANRRWLQLLFCQQDCFPKAGGEQHCQYQSSSAPVQVGNWRCRVNQYDFSLSHCSEQTALSAAALC